MSGLPLEWKAKDGRVMAIKDMDTSHIINTLKMLIREHQAVGTWEPYSAAFQAELRARGLDETAWQHMPSGNT